MTTILIWNESSWRRSLREGSATAPTVSLLLMFGQQNAARLSHFIWKGSTNIVLENRERCHWETLSCPFYYGQLSPLFSLFCSVPLFTAWKHSLLHRALQHYRSGVAPMVSFQQPSKAPPQFHDAGFKLFQHTPGALAVAADQKRSQPCWPFSHALRDVLSTSGL